MFIPFHNGFYLFLMNSSSAKISRNRQSLSSLHSTLNNTQNNKKVSQFCWRLNPLLAGLSACPSPRQPSVNLQQEACRETKKRGDETLEWRVCWKGSKLLFARRISRRRRTTYWIRAFRNVKNGSWKCEMTHDAVSKGVHFNIVLQFMAVWQPLRDI